MGKQWKQCQTLFLGAPKSLQVVTASMKLKDSPWKKSYDQPRQHIQKQRHYFANKALFSQGYGFSCGHVWMWELDYKESWALKNWCFWTVMLVKTLESPLECKEIQPVHPKEVSPGCSLEGLMLKLKLQYFGHLMRGVDSLEKTLMLGEIGGRRRRGRQRMRWLDGITELPVASHCCTLAWKIPWTKEPGRLQSLASRRVGHDWATSLSLFTFTHWRRSWQPTPVFLPGEPQGWGSLVGCHLWGRTESDTTEVT